LLGAAGTRRSPATAFDGGTRRSTACTPANMANPPRSGTTGADSRTSITARAPSATNRPTAEFAAAHVDLPHVTQQPRPRTALGLAGSLLACTCVDARRQLRGSIGQ
jgi:hypothetical protein